ncbi:MAG: class I SAM-dependent methyltransferase [Gemmatimonadetes bacterium]|nr:class I SAM-dependent methyltransferase [Gemmatimonadota bacterium]
MSGPPGHELYDRIGGNYRRLRGEDPRLAARIRDELGDARRVVNVGAGTGHYEPADRAVIAVEPSATMIRQRPQAAAPVIRGRSDALPFRAGRFDAAMAILTVHHWDRLDAGLAELARVAAGRVVLMTWDPAFPGFWLTDYFPGLLDVDRRIFPPLDRLASALGGTSVRNVPIPHDCRDGFLGAYWRRPESYLDPAIRSGMSTFARIPDVEAGVERLGADLESGAFGRRYADLLSLPEADLGYRLVSAGAG